MNFYKNDMMTAKANDEITVWRDSFRESCSCAKAIDKGLNDNFANNRLDTDKVLDTVVAEYGTERVTHILAAQIVNHDWDGRYHSDVKAWAREQTKELSAEFMEDSRDYYLTAHPILINGLAIKVMQREKEMIASLEQELIERFNETMEFRENTDYSISDICIKKGENGRFVATACMDFIWYLNSHDKHTHIDDAIFVYLDNGWESPYLLDRNNDKENSKPRPKSEQER